MSVSGISTSSLYHYNSAQTSVQQIQQTFQQLGQDLQSGNLSAAQSDFAALLKLAPQLSSTPTSSAQNSSPIAQAFRQLARDLQSGNLSAAQQDFSTIQQDFQNQAAQSQTSATRTQGHHHHHHHHQGGSSGSSEVSQLLDQLGTALQSGNLASAQQAFSSLQQRFQQSAPGNGSQIEPSPSSSNSVSITA
jgi:outer membrane protein assembly factor BamD (BamD/ComL family)